MSRWKRSGGGVNGRNVFTCAQLSDSHGKFLFSFHCDGCDRFLDAKRSLARGFNAETKQADAPKVYMCTRPKKLTKIHYSSASYTSDMEESDEEEKEEGLVHFKKNMMMASPPSHVNRPNPSPILLNKFGLPNSVSTTYNKHVVAFIENSLETLRHEKESAVRLMTEARAELASVVEPRPQTSAIPLSSCSSLTTCNSRNLWINGYHRTA
jgi:hypothetical protein